MNVSLTAELEKYVRGKVASGLYNNSSEVIREALRLRVENESPVLAFDDTAADAYRQIVEAVGYSRRKPMDRMIAAEALVHRATLVTMNAADFRDVPGLELPSW